MRLSVARIRFLFSLIVVCVLVLVVRLYTIQVMNADAYERVAERQHTRSNPSIFSRGTIYFRAKDGTPISAATLQSGSLIALNPQNIQDAESVYEKLSPILSSIDKDNFLARAGKKDDPYEEIARKLDSTIGERARALALPGVHVYPDRWRFYPGEEMAAHTLGIVAYKGNDLGGRYGLERFYEDVLRRDTQTSYANFFVDIFLNIKDSISNTQGKEGDIYTTIEPSVQAFLERELASINKQWSSDYTGGIVIDPSTGEIIALGISPTFNPNSFQEEKSSLVFSNPLVENVYEMGSIIKPLTLAAGLDTKAITPQTTYLDKGFVTINNKTISNYDGVGRGVVSMQEVLNQSLNTGVAHVVGAMGKDSFAQYMLRFGLGEKTGIDLPNEASSLVENLKSPRDIEHVTASFGQGIATSPMVVVRALSALANDGVLVRPHLVSKIQYTSGFSKKVDMPEGRRVVSKETSEIISRMLVETVDTSIIEGKIQIPNYSVAAKTGTAQIANPSGGGYYDDRFLHSFFGYFPAYEPRFLVFLFTYHPKNVRFSSQTLPIPFMNIAKYLINYYEIPPDR